MPAPEVVDLLDDDSSSDEGNEAVVAKHKHEHQQNQQKRLNSATTSRDIAVVKKPARVSLDSSVLAGHPSVAGTSKSGKKKSWKASSSTSAAAEPASDEGKNVVVLEIDSSDDEASVAPTSTTVATADPNQQKKKTVGNNHREQSSNKRAFLQVDGLDSDSDEDSVLNYDGYVVPTKKKSALVLPAVTTGAAPLKKNIEPSSSQETVSTTATAAGTAIYNPSWKQTTKQKATLQKLKSSPAATTILNPYAKKDSNTTSPKYSSATNANANAASTPISSSEFPYPTFTARSTQYEDIRAKGALALWKYARSSLTQRSYDRSKLDQTINKLVAFALWSHPLRSLEEFMQRKRSAASSRQLATAGKRELEMQLTHGCFDRVQIPVNASRSQGKYSTIVEACLVAMSDIIQERVKRNNNNSNNNNTNQQRVEDTLSLRDNFVTLHELIPEIENRLLPECPRFLRRQDNDGGVAYYTAEGTRSAEYAQIKKLQATCTQHQTEIVTGYIKQRKEKKQVVFELLPLGYSTAIWIKERVYPAPPGHYRASHIATLNEVELAYRGICLAVDLREGGFQKFVLHDMANALDMKKVPYVVGTLDIGDYAFFSTKPGQTNLLCPILVERKSIQDLAGSIADGRWVTQKQRMYHGQFVFGYENCRICYLIEGKEEKQHVTGDYIADRRLGVTREQLDNAIEGLQSEGFDVLRTSSTKDSMFQLAKWAGRVAQEVRSGNLKPQFTYEQFKAEVKKIPKATDFSRLAKDAMNTRLEKEQDTADMMVEEEAEEAEEKKPAAIPSKSTTAAAKVDSVIDLCDNDDGNDRMLDGHKSPTNKSDEDTDDEVMVSTKRMIERYRKKQRKREEKRKRRGEGKRAEEKTKKRKVEEDATESKTDNNDDTSSVKGKDGGVKPGSEYAKMSLQHLRQKCEESFLPKTGSKKELIARLLGPKPPKLWCERKRAKQYVPPRADVGNTAILVALYLQQREDNSNPQAPGMTKDEIYVKADELDIKKDSFSGGTTQNGPYHYDGWSGHKSLMEGERPLMSKQKFSRYKLTREGFDLAKAMHKWCHELGICACSAMQDYYTGR